MTINIESTTDSKEAVTAALGDLAPKASSDGKTEEPIKAKSEDAIETEVEAIEPEAGAETDPSENEEETETEETEDVSEDEQDEILEQKPKKKGGFQKRIDRLNKKFSQAEQEKEYWRQEALRAQQKSANEKPPTIATEKIDIYQKPVVDNFETHEAFVEALTDWKLEQKLLAKEREQKESAIKSEAQVKASKHLERVSSFKESHDDFDEVLESVGEIKLATPLQIAIRDSDNSAEIMYELAKQPKELKRIAELSPESAIRELGKFEARFLKPSTTTSSEKKTTKAPTPVTPVRPRGSASAKSIYDDGISQSEYEKLRAEQIKQRRA